MNNEHLFLFIPISKAHRYTKMLPATHPVEQEQKGLSVSFCRLCVSFLINLPQQPRDNEGVTRTQRKGDTKEGGCFHPYNQGPGLLSLWQEGRRDSQGQ